MKIQLDRSGSIDSFKLMLQKAEEDNEIKSVLVFTCDANGFNPEMLDPILKKYSKKIFGGIFPEIMHQTQKYSTGTIVAGFKNEIETYIIRDLSNMEADYEEMLEKIIPETISVKTMFVFIDGFAKRISALIDSLFNYFGLEMNYIGGGAGSLSFVQKPVLISNEGLIEDAAVLAFSNIESGVGVNHGWQEVAGPFKVTESDRNIIKSLDWTPAFEVYKDIVEAQSDQRFNDDNFFEISKGFPFGISKLGTEKIVRDPIALGKDGSLVCVGEVPQDVFVHILKGNTKSLVNAAEKALSLSKNSFNHQAEHQTTLFIDCISRVLFLEGDFQQELDAVSSPSIPLIGALTLGEIANSGKDYLEFYNKTSVVGVLTE